MSCLPGMPCYPIGPVYPEGMGPCNPCAQCSIDSALVKYTGPDLSCSGINTNDPVSLALQKLDNATCPENILNGIFQILQTNPAMRATFCTFVNGCITTTSTTTSVPTTTTTTTI